MWRYQPGVFYMSIHIPKMQPPIPTWRITDSYLGPEIDPSSEFRAADRLYSENLAPAYVPGLLIYKGVKGYCSRSVDELMLRPPVTIELLTSLKEDIKNHFEGRIAHFWMCALLIHNTGLLFNFCDAADAQIGGPGSSRLVPETEVKAAREFAAAHPATLPALQLHIAEKTHKAIAFGRGSFFHRLANATTWLPVVVNQIDTALDRTARLGARYSHYNHSFRYLTTHILNDLSSNLINPHEGLHYFLTYVLDYLPAIGLSEKRDMREFVINCYREVAESYLKKMYENDFLIKALCGSVTDRSPLEAIYARVQADMHYQFVHEMHALKPIVIADPRLEHQLAVGVDLSRFKAIIAGFLKEQSEKGAFAVSKKAGQYVKASLQVKNVRIVALQYLTGLADEKSLKKDLEKAVTIKTNAKIEGVRLNAPIFAVYSQIFEALVQGGAPKGLRNMNAILIRVLDAVSGDPKI